MGTEISVPPVAICVVKLLYLFNMGTEIFVPLVNGYSTDISVPLLSTYMGTKISVPLVYGY